MRIETNSSTRIYKNKLDDESLNNLYNTLHVGNEAKIKAYALLTYGKEELTQSIHMTIKNLFKLNTYYTNYAICEANWDQKSNIELNKIYITDTADNIKHIKAVIKKLSGKIKYWTTIHKHIIGISKSIKHNEKLPKLKYYMPYYFHMEGNKVLIDANYKKETIVYNMYDFEHAVVTKKISDLTNRVNMIKRKLSYQNLKLEKLKTSIIKSCFGTKKLFKSQYTLCDDHFDWKEGFYKSRHRTIELQGLKTVTQGNACVKYNYDKNTLNIQLPFENIVGDKVNHTPIWTKINNVDFPYHRTELIEALATPGTPVSWRIEDKGDYFLFKPTYTVFREEAHINYSKQSGIVGYDINYNHIAWSDIDEIGNLLDFGTIKFDIEGKSSGQIAKILEKVTMDLVNIAKAKNKPLAGEDIKNINKSQLAYGNAKRNRRISMFAHAKIIEAVSSRAFKENLEVFYINPAYTSQMGKIKYMKAKGISIHISAAYCIARKSLGYVEKTPRTYKKFTTVWQTLSKELKSIRIHYFYKLPRVVKYNNLKSFVLDVVTLNRINITEKPRTIFVFK